MSHAELRTKAIEVIAEGIWANDRLREAEKALDALGAAGFPVLGPEVTEEMEDAAFRLLSQDPSDKTKFLAMVHAGDLTRKP